MNTLYYMEYFNLCVREIISLQWKRIAKRILSISTGFVIWSCQSMLIKLPFNHIGFKVRICILFRFCILTIESKWCKPVWTIVLICITVVSAVILWHLKQAQKKAQRFDDENLAMVDTREFDEDLLYLTAFRTMLETRSIPWF